MRTGPSPLPCYLAWARSISRQGDGRGSRFQHEGRGGQDAVRGAAHRAAPPVQDMGVDHRGAHILVAQELLDGPDVVAILEEVGGKGVSERVRGAGFAMPA